MLALMILCFVIYISVYVHLKSFGESMSVRPIQSFDDYFIDFNES